MPERFKVVGTGSREYPEVAPVHRVLDELLLAKGFVFMAQGGAPGVDKMIKQWAVRHHMLANGPVKPVHLKTYPANWRPNGVFNRSAGLARNEQMVNEVRPHLVIAFIHENSRGSTHCARYAIQYKFETMIFRSDGTSEHWVDGEQKAGPVGINL